MDLGLQLFTKPTDIQILNACGLHLQVTLLSDITTTDGKTILPSVTIGLWPLSSMSSQLFFLPNETIQTRLAIMEQTRQHTHAHRQTQPQTTSRTMVFYKKTST